MLNIMAGMDQKDSCEVYSYGQVVDMPAVVNDSCPMVQTVLKTVGLCTVAVHLKGGRCPCCVVVQAPQLHVETADIPQLQVVEISSLHGSDGEDCGFLRPFYGPFSHSVHLDVELPGGGDAGSLLPGVLPPELGASYARAWIDTPC